VVDGRIQSLVRKEWRCGGEAVADIVTMQCIMRRECHCGGKAGIGNTSERTIMLHNVV